MVKEELIQRSAIKALEEMTGGLEAGEMGVIASPSGLGKTSVLVQIALYKLLQGLKVVHVSFTQQTSYVFSWYEDILGELLGAKNAVPKATQDLLDDVMKNRVILNFNQQGVTSDVIRASLSALIKEGGFAANSIIIDGFDFSQANPERIGKLKDFVREAGVSLWYSCAAKAGASEADGTPNALAPLKDDIDVLLKLEEKSDHIALSVLKNRAKAVDTRTLKLDPKTLLLA
jgi:hypothetical protein